MALDTNLGSYWKFDTSPGLLVDSHGSRTLTNTGSVTTDASGKLGQRAVFDTTRCLSAGTFAAPAGAMSVSGWVYPVDSRTEVIAAQYREGTSTAWQIFLLSGVDVYFRIHSGTAGTAMIGRSKTSAFTLNAWNHLVATWNGGGTNGDLKIYVNGSQVDDTNAGSGSFTVISTTPVALTLGAQFSSVGAVQFGVNGYLDEFAFWEDRELSGADVTSLYNGGAALDYSLFGGGSFRAAWARGSNVLLGGGVAR